MSVPADRDRGAGSRSSLVLAVVGFLVLAVVYIEVDRMPVSVTQMLVGDLGYLLPEIGAAVLAGVAVFRSRGPERRLWALVGALYALIVAAELNWVWVVFSTGAPPAPVTASFAALHSMAALLYLAVVAYLSPMSGSHRLVAVRQALDIISFGIVVYVSMFFVSVNPLFSAVPGATPGDALAGSIYPTWAVLMLAGLVWPVFASGRGYMRRSWQRLLVAGLIAYALGIGAWPLWFAEFMRIAPSGEQTIIEVLQILSHYLVMLALLWRLRLADDRWSPPRMAPTSTRTARVLGYLMIGSVMVAMPVMIGGAIASPDGSLTRYVLEIASIGLAVLTVARTVLTAVESGRLLRSSKTDPLTGLFNHRHFHEALQESLEKAARYDSSVAVLVLDLDGFDEVNARHGHPAGDAVLRSVGKALRDACGDAGVMCRVGGDEFAAVLPGADEESALRIALDVRRKLADVRMPGGDKVTASSGIALYPSQAEDPETLRGFADGAAYWVKRHGKDHALVYSPQVVTELSPSELVRAAEQQAEAGIVRALAAAVDARHECTSTHSVAVAAWSTEVARRLGLDEERVRRIETAALLHDVGMIAVSEEVLQKPGPLTEAEMCEIREHPRLGERIVSGTIQEPVLSAILHHQEHWDGTGYPDGLRAVAIPLESRILHVCGAYDAMTSPRPYRPAMSVSQAVDLLRAGAGAQFDPAVVEVFLEGLGALGRLRPDL